MKLKYIKPINTPNRNSVHSIMLILLIISGLNAVTVAQVNKPVFEHLTMEDGLSSNKTEMILQDRQGFYWISTHNGLNRFDGTHFRVFLHDPDNPNSITHNNCSTILEDLQGDLWIATYDGVSRYRRKTEKFERLYLHYNNPGEAIYNRVSDIAFDSKKNVWISGYGLWKFDPASDSLMLIRHNPDQLSTIPNFYIISSIIQDTFHHGLWLRTDAGLAYYDEASDQFFHKAFNPKNWKVFEAADDKEITLDVHGQLWFRNLQTQTLASFDPFVNEITVTSYAIRFGVKDLASDDAGRIWILYFLAPTEIYTPHSSTPEIDFFHEGHDHSLTDTRLTRVFVDKQKNYWLATKEGINIYKSENQFYRTFAIEEDILGYEKDPLRIKSFVLDSTGLLWVGTNTGLYTFNVNESKHTRIQYDGDQGVSRAMCIANSILWFFTHEELHGLDLKKRKIVYRKKFTPGAFFLLPGTQNDLWLGIWTSGLYRIDLQSKNIEHFREDSSQSNTIQSNYVMTGLVDGDQFWLGYNLGKGFSKFSTGAKTWTHYHPQIKQDKINPMVINSMLKSRDDRYWLGTHGDGIILFNESNSTYTNFQQHQGLQSNFINSIIEDDLGNLWISTPDGLNHMEVNQSVIVPLAIGMIFPTNDFYPNGLKDEKGNIYFFANHELIIIDPKKYARLPGDSSMVISSFKIFDEEYPVDPSDPKLDLSYRQNFFSFTFSLIKTNPHERVQYAYILKGFDKDWHYTSEQNIASYTNVSNGRYVFMVKAMNTQGEWSAPLVSIPIRVHPPFWDTWWFIILVILSILGLFTLFHRYRIAQVKKIISMRTRISQDLHDDIGGSLSSIHIYSSVAEREMRTNPEKATAVLQKIKMNSRQVMDDISDIVWANKSSTRNEGLLGVRIRGYGHDLLSQKNIDCHYDIDPLADKRITKPEARRNILLIIKEAIHNISKYSDATEVEISLKQKGLQLEVKIADNGIGFNEKTIQNGNGLKNIRQRADALGGEVTIESSPGKGTAVLLKAPLPNISGE